MPPTSTAPMGSYNCRYPNQGSLNMCPSPFPTFTEATDAAPTCQLAVVGAGTGGLYTALRLVDTGKYSGSSICIFEMTERVGGRLYSLRGFGPDQDLVVDAGGYRTWPEYTPVTHALISEYLGLPVHCYDPADDPCTKFNIGLIEGGERKAGFATFVEVMMERLIAAGAKWYPKHELVSISQSSSAGSKQLTFSNGAQAVATKLVLNVPQRPLLYVLRESSLPTGALTSEIFEGLHSVQTEVVVKVYLYYSDAWWRNRLGLDSGDFADEGDATEMPLKGRYHDGDVKCDANGQNCAGFLLATYAHDHAGTNEMFLGRFKSHRNAPTTIIGNTDPEGAAFLQHAHDRLIYYHKYLGASSDPRYTGFSVRNLQDETSPPDFAVIATWDIGTPGAGGGWHGWIDIDAAKVAVAMDPLGSHGIHVVNEAYSFVQGWAEGTLQLSDSILTQYFGVDRPWSVDNSPLDTATVLRQTKEDCRAPTAAPVSSGGGGGASDALCFTGDALLTLANGTRVPLHSVRTGDRVWTGDAAGIVTEGLAHRVGAPTTHSPEHARLGPGE